MDGRAGFDESGFVPTPAVGYWRQKIVGYLLTGRPYPGKGEAKLPVG
jgi:hypothetical protein